MQHRAERTGASRHLHGIRHRTVLLAAARGPEARGHALCATDGDAWSPRALVFHPRWLLRVPSPPELHAPVISYDIREALALNRVLRCLCTVACTKGSNITQVQQ